MGSTTAAGGQAGTAEKAYRTQCKRGVAYGHHSAADLDALSPGISWWYNWAYKPDSELPLGYGRKIGVQYVPMAWDETFDPTAMTAAISADSGALLGFNEPNFYAQANLSAADSARLWPKFTQIAEAKGLRLVSPAVNYCGGRCWDTDPIQYLKDFFAACTDCRVDAIAVHIYVGCNAGGTNHATWLIDHLKTYEKEFKQPLWVTEFACNDAANEGQQKDFLVDAVTYLESDPRVERYAWFAGRADNVPHVDLLGASGQLTDLGKSYVSLPAAPGCTNP